MILQIETATSSCSVALASEGKVLAFKQLAGRNVHAEMITLFIGEVTAAAGIRYSDLDAIAVSSGPGSYTGLRIGVSTAKGLCFALDKPLIAIETLEAMAYGVVNRPGYQGVHDTLLCPMIDARRMEVYTAVFNSGGARVKPTAAEIIDEDSFCDLLADRKILFFGDGAEKCREALGSSGNAMFLTDFINSATDLTAKALEKLRKRVFEDVAYFEPFYLKDFIAGKRKF
ncbi:MAG TPA: tRNA (adenosine(37)-N6)-threonylcarbamoyltransferase complex dimerization subunit type 1 TsaB [Mucilaginibacter sp.]|jgi:tRNA threonylcarbamoyladenosine biosynthesis protein TsaB|nr:tRNA (adenosine(37)-N6)-threonylcarbamoyltransferase complex dimerization subunit type 1 TsaB [Mucilaginibacter sp.]